LGEPFLLVFIGSPEADNYPHYEQYESSLIEVNQNLGEPLLLVLI
jgi:hypothetical protein